MLFLFWLISWSTSCDASSAWGPRLKIRPLLSCFSIKNLGYFWVFLQPVFDWGLLLRNKFSLLDTRRSTTEGGRHRRALQSDWCSSATGKDSLIKGPGSRLGPTPQELDTHTHTSTCRPAYTHTPCIVFCRWEWRWRILFVFFFFFFFSGGWNQHCLIGHKVFFLS